MGKASRNKSGINRRDRIAAQRAAERQREQRNRLMIAGGSILAVVVIVVGFVVYGAVSHSNSNKVAGASNGPTGAALASVVKDVTGVPASALGAVAGGGASSGGFKGISGPPLSSGGKPEIFYDGAEYCPFCAAERWAMVVALSRFGTFSGLTTVHSSTTDNPANIPTWTFHGSVYTSKYLTFTPVEETSNVPDAATKYYTLLDKPTSAQTALMKQYDSNGGIPFLDFGGKYVQSGDLAMLQPTSLSGDWTKIATDLSNPSTGNAKAVLAAANWTTAAICKLTGDQPASACTPAVQALEPKL
jgi:hypothetical protein